MVPLKSQKCLCHAGSFQKPLRPAIAVAREDAHGGPRKGMAEREEPELGDVRFIAVSADELKVTAHLYRWLSCPLARMVDCQDSPRKARPLVPIFAIQHLY